MKASYQLTWLADVLRAAGLRVVEADGWQGAGTGEMGVVKGVLLHHTAGPKKGVAPSLAIVRDGRSDLRGPLSQLFLDREGTFHVLAAGRCNHAGKGAWHGASGNSELIGIEAENAGDGTDPWPDVQMDAYVRGVAALLTKLAADPVMAAGHKEYATPRGRKIDPAFDMDDFRQALERVMLKSPKKIVLPASVDPKRSMLRKGHRGGSVVLLQQKLGMPLQSQDGDFGPKTERAVKAFQESNGLTVDGIVGPATWKALGE